MKLFAAKLRGPFLKESANPLATIFRKIARHLLLDFLLKCSSEFFLFAGKQSFFHCADRQRRTLRDFLSERLHLVFELRGGRNAIHNAEAQRGLRVYHVASIKKLSSLRRAHQLR